MIQLAADKQIAHLMRDLRHPSLHAKKYDEAQDVWQARITGSWRLYFQIDDEGYLLLDMISHPK